MVGGANVDIEGRAPGPLLLGTPTRGPWPGHRAVLVATSPNLARLGVPTRLITALGHDHNGTWLHDRTADAGVDLVDSVWSESAPTATYLSVIDGSGEMAVAVNDMAVMDALDVAALDTRRDTVAHATAVVEDCNPRPRRLAASRVTWPARPLFVDPVSSAKAGPVRTPPSVGAHPQAQPR